MSEKLPPGCLYGKTLRRLEVSSFILTETAHRAMSRLPWHAHKNSYFCFVLRGVYTEKFGQREFDCKPSTLTFRPAGEFHEDRFHDQDGRVLVLEIPPSWIERLKENSMSLNCTFKFGGGCLPRLAANMNREFHKADTAASLAIEGLILELMAETARQSSRSLYKATPQWLKQARELLIEHFSDNLTLGFIAGQVGVHPVHLATVFHQQYGCTIGEFVRRLRVENACHRLVKEDVSFASIALETGFADQSHFSKVFKLYTGMTPTEYKKERNIKAATHH